MRCLLYLSSDVGRRSILLSGHVSFIFLFRRSWQMTV